MNGRLMTSVNFVTPFSCCTFDSTFTMYMVCKHVTFMNDASENWFQDINGTVFWQES